MANVIKHKRGSGSDPVASDLVVGEVAIRTDVGKLFTKMDNGSVAEIAGGGSDIAINTLSSSSGTGGGSATFNGSAFRFTLSSPPSVSAQQLLVSINGVIQKPVAGTGQPSEGFSVDGTDIILGDAPAAGSDFFILTFRSLGVSEPADNSVTSAKIVDGAIVNADINASAAIAKSKLASLNITNADIDNNAGIAFSKLANLPAQLTGSTNNTIPTVTGANTLQGEANLTFNGNKLSVTPNKNSNNDGFEVVPADGTTASHFKVLGNNNAGADGRNGGATFIDANYFADASTIFDVAGRGTSRFSITGAGHVGIGTQSPIAKFAVSDGTTTLDLNPTSGIGFVGTRSNHPVHFTINAAVKAAIDTAGRFLVGTTSNNVNGSSSKFQVSYSKTGEFGIFIRPFDNNTGGGEPILFQNQAGTSIGSVSANASNVSYNTSSDYRLKENIVAISDGITRLKTLKPSRFNFKADKDKTVDGFLAHEVTAVPEAITGTKDEVDENNEPIYQGIDQSKLVPLLVAALQEAIGRIEALEAK